MVLHKAVLCEIKNADLYEYLTTTTEIWLLVHPDFQKYLKAIGLKAKYHLSS